MNILLEYLDYVNNLSLSLPNGIVLTNNERMEMCKIISNAINTYFTFDKYSREPFVIDGIKLYPEYISKAVNNRTLLKKIVSDSTGEIISNIKTKEDLFSFVKDNSFDLFSINGKYFKYVYKLLSNTSNKGKKFEKDAFIFFEEIAKKKGLNIKVEDPSLKEDIYDGIDGVFFHNGKRFTIQVKPLSRLEESKHDITKYIVYCDGMLQKLKTDYLIAINNKECYVFRCSGSIVNDKYFIIPKENLTG